MEGENMLPDLWKIFFEISNNFLLLQVDENVLTVHFLFKSEEKYFQYFSN